jgi:hypothetical protein
VCWRMEFKLEYLYASNCHFMCFCLKCNCNIFFMFKHLMWFLSFSLTGMITYCLTGNRTGMLWTSNIKVYNLAGFWAGSFQFTVEPRFTNLIRS